MKRIIVICFILCILAMIFMLGFCEAESKEYVWPKSLVVVTPSAGTVAYSNVLGWAAVLEKSTGMRTRVIPLDVPPTVAKMLRDGNVDMNFEPLGACTYTLEATQGAASRDGGPYQMRVGYCGMTAFRGYIVRGDSKIKTIYDIGPETRIAQPPIPGIVNKNYALLAWLKLDKKDIVEVKLSSMGATLEAVADGRADVVNTGFTGAAVAQLQNNPKGIRVLPLPYKEDKEGAARFLEVNAVESFGECTVGIKEALGLPSIVQPYFHYWSANADPDLLYNLTKWFAENYDAYKDNEPSLPSMTLDNFIATLDYTPFPVHEGTIKYLKEKGFWTSENEARQQRNIELIDKYMKAYKEAIAMADEKKIDVKVTNQAWIDLWENYKKEQNLPRFVVKY
jgi:TRAP transporter TAXI family solute receptor